ncbi:hydroxyisourate hydrolase [Pelagibacterium limicola]|uniref:hydroxyisourate hydrolase n=1 Tax=Pelagibacterium limicola TaxID=2791022 RepID=UPI0018AF69AC|nr:hydroxyisourate hydrolase [Pelagibacterium limicola]
MSGSGRLTTHVLDTANGHPARGLAIDLFRMIDGVLTHLKRVATNDDGRVDVPLLEGVDMGVGAFELQFHVGDYFRELHGTAATFLDVVPVRFVISDPDAHYHVPLLVSPFGYSTYRGS